MGEWIEPDLFSDEGPAFFAAAGKLHARATDPESSHRAAARGFDAPRGMPQKILDVLHISGEWHTCQEIAKLIFGDGPYVWSEVIAINKVQTYTLNLHRQGKIERREIGIAGHVIEYRRNQP